MLIVGSTSDIEEQKDIRSIAKIFIIGERFRCLALQQKNKEKLMDYL